MGTAGRSHRWSCFAAVLLCLFPHGGHCVPPTEPPNGFACRTYGTSGRQIRKVDSADAEAVSIRHCRTSCSVPHCGFTRLHCPLGTAASAASHRTYRCCGFQQRVFPLRTPLDTSFAVLPSPRLKVRLRRIRRMNRRTPGFRTAKDNLVRH